MFDFRIIINKLLFCKVLLESVLNERNRPIISGNILTNN